MRQSACPRLELSAQSGTVSAQSGTDECSERLWPSSHPPRRSLRVYKGATHPTELRYLPPHLVPCSGCCLHIQVELQRSNCRNVLAHSVRGCHATPVRSAPARGIPWERESMRQFVPRSVIGGVHGPPLACLGHGIPLCLGHSATSLRPTARLVQPTTVADIIQSA
jgi:hypothetical protein